METSYEIPNLINQGKHVGTRIKKTAIFHAQIGVKYHEYYIRWVNSETLNLMFKVDSLRKFHTAMWLEDMNPRKQSTVDREKKVLEIMRIFLRKLILKTQSVYVISVHAFLCTMKLCQFSKLLAISR